MKSTFQTSCATIHLIFIHTVSLYISNFQIFKHLYHHLIFAQKQYSLNNSLRAGTIFESYGIPDLLSESTAELLRDALGHGHGGDSARLRARHLAARRQPAPRHVLRHLRRLTRPSLTYHY